VQWPICYIVIMPKGPQGQKRPAGAIGKVVKVMPIATREKTETATAEEGRNQAAEALGLSIWPVGSGRPVTPRAGLAKIAQDRADDAVLGTGLLLFSLRAGYWRRGAGTATAHIGHYCRGVPSGLLMSYGQNFPDYVRRAEAYVDKSLKGHPYHAADAGARRRRVIE
jgi:hypothetical protein